MYNHYKDIPADQFITVKFVDKYSDKTVTVNVYRRIKLYRLKYLSWFKWFQIKEYVCDMYFSEPIGFNQDISHFSVHMEKGEYILNVVKQIEDIGIDNFEEYKWTTKPLKKKYRIKD